MKNFRNPDSIHPPVANYTHHIEVSEVERLLFLSGQIGMDKDGEIPEDPLEQLELALHNVLQNLAAADMDVSDLTKLTFYVVGDIDAAKRKDIVENRLDGHLPCQTLVFVAALANPALKVEIDAFAVSDA